MGEGDREEGDEGGVLVAWAAGLFEGEGCIVVHRHAQGTRRQLTLRMCDQDVVEKFAQIVSAGTVYKREAKNERHRDAWEWGVYNWADCSRVLTMLLPYFGDRRAAKAREFLATPLTYNGETCHKGHELDGRRGDGSKYCRTCARDRARTT